MIRLYYFFVDDLQDGEIQVVLLVSESRDKNPLTQTETYVIEQVWPAGGLRADSFAVGWCAGGRRIRENWSVLATTQVAFVRRPFQVRSKRKGNSPHVACSLFAL